MASHVSFSDKLNFEAQYSIYKYLNELTQNMRWLRLSAFVALGASSLTHLVTKTTSAVEELFHGTGVILKTPFSENSSSNLQRGWKILKQSPSNGVSIIYLPFSMVISIILILSEPKLFILEMDEIAKVDLKHLQAGSVDTDEHIKDSSEATGRAKKKLIEYQQSIR